MVESILSGRARMRQYARTISMDCLSAKSYFSDFSCFSLRNEILMTSMISIMDWILSVGFFFSPKFRKSIVDDECTSADYFPNLL